MGWQSFVPPALLGAGHSEWWLFCVQEICPDIPWQVPAGSSTDQDLGPGGVVCPSLALCGQGRAHWSWGCWTFPLGLLPWCVLALTGFGLWQLAAFWLSKGGREEGICTWNRGKRCDRCWAAPGHWPRPRAAQHSDVHSVGSAWMLSVQFWQLLWSLHVLPGSGSSCCSRGRGLQGWREPSGSLVGWQGEGVVWQGSSRELGRAGNTEPVCLSLSDESLPLCVQGGQRGGGCSWFPAGACGGLCLQLSAVGAEPCPSSL